MARRDGHRGLGWPTVNLRPRAAIGDDHAEGCRTLTWNQAERLVASYLGVINAGFALTIIIGGAIRFPPPTYRPLLNATNGEVWPYGVLFGLSAFGLLGGSWTVRLVGAVLGIAAHSTFAALFLVAVLSFPDAGATAWWAYLVFASQSAACAGLVWTHRGHHRRLQVNRSA